MLGVLAELGTARKGHYSESAHALRRAQFETGFLNDPQVFDAGTSSSSAGRGAPSWPGYERRRPAPWTGHGGRPDSATVATVSRVGGPDLLVVECDPTRDFRRRARPRLLGGGRHAARSHPFSTRAQARDEPPPSFADDVGRLVSDFAPDAYG